MPYRELVQAEAFTTAVRTSLSRGQAIQLLSALASLGKDEEALAHHDWVEVAPLEGASAGITRLTIRDDEDSCWSAFVVFDGDANALVMLYAAPGDQVSLDDLSRIEAAFTSVGKAMNGLAPEIWRW